MIAFRDTEIFALGRALSSHRIVVLTGPPGIGKSAIATAFAYQKQHGKRLGRAESSLASSSPAPSSSSLASSSSSTHQTWVVTCRLEGARTAIDIVHELARVLGITTSANAEASSIAERIGRVLAARRRILIVLDDVDRSRVALAKLLPGWQREAPTASFLVTARGRLGGVANEHRIEVGPLDVPGARERDAEAIASSPSVQLFASRASAARGSTLRITAANARAVASIVRKLEGVPLAIELCASRMVALSEQDIVELLDERLDLLEDERGERSIRSAFALSWDELDEADAHLLAACSCFRGGFLLDAACAVGADEGESTSGSGAGAANSKSRLRVARALERLVEGSLVRVDDHGKDGSERRYSLSETLRAFAAEKLDERSEESWVGAPEAIKQGRRSLIEERHARHYGRLRTTEPVGKLDVIAAERKNLEEAFDRSLKANTQQGQGGGGRHTEYGVAALLAHAPVVLTRGPLAPFIERAGRALDRLALSPKDRAELLYSRGLARVFQGKRDEGLIDMLAAREEARGPAKAKRVEALAASKIGVVTGLKGNVEEALAIFEEATAAAEAAKDDLARGIVRKDLANILAEAGRNDDAVVELGRARKFLRAAGDSREEGFVLMMLGSRFVDDGRLKEARRDLTAGLALLREAGDHRSEAWSLCLLSLVDAEEGDLSSARRQLETALALIRDVGDEHTEGLLLGFLGNVALEQGVLGDAESAYRDCVVRLARAGDRASEGLFTAAAAVVEHALGRTPSARDGFERARELLEGDGRAARRAAVEVLASILSDSDSSKPKDKTKTKTTTTTTKTKAAGKTDPVEEIRFAHRVVAAMKKRTAKNSTGDDNDGAAATSGIVVASDGSWVRTASGQITKLGANHPIARVMHQLALERVRHPGRPVSPQALVRAGWPGERVLPAAAKNRLHVTIARLRRVALEAALLHDEEGYFLDPRETTRLADPGELPR